MNHAKLPFVPHKPSVSNGYVFVLDDSGDEVATCYHGHIAGENANFIAQACNAHAWLVEAAKEGLRVLNAQNGEVSESVWNGNYSAIRLLTDALAIALADPRPTESVHELQIVDANRELRA